MFDWQLVDLSISPGACLPNHCQTASEANAIARFSPSSLAAACDGPNWLDSERKISKSARNTG